MQEMSNSLKTCIWAKCPYPDEVICQTSALGNGKADASSMDQNGPLEVPLQVTSI